LQNIYSNTLSFIQVIVDMPYYRDGKPLENVWKLILSVDVSEENQTHTEMCVGKMGVPMYDRYTEFFYHVDTSEQ